MISGCLHTRNRVLDAFDNAYNEMQKLYDDDKLEEVYESAQILLADAAIPRYHRMKTLMLLSNFTSDIDEAQRYHAEAEAMWRIVRGNTCYVYTFHLLELSYDALDITVLLPPFFAGDVATGPIEAIKRVQSPLSLRTHDTRHRDIVTYDCKSMSFQMC
jgi:hypothetical protein